MTAIRSVVLGCGSYLPQRVLTNAELAAQDRHVGRMDRAAHRHPAAPYRRRGRVHLASGDQCGARRRWPMPAIDAQSIDLIVLATSTPDNTFPATAVAVQDGLGIHHGAAFDLQAVCSGFVFALATADNFLRAGALQARAGDRRRDVFAHPRLERPRHLRAVRRRRRRGRAGGAGAAGQAVRPRRADDASALRRPAQVEAAMSTADRPRPEPSATCGWKAARSSSTRSA